MHLADKLLSSLDRAIPRLERLTEERVSTRSPGKWSKKEILGHLIDSAVNNCRRFILAQHQDSLIFDGYDQEKWVVVQQYQTAQWPDLLELWLRLNQQIARCIHAIPEDILTRQHKTHNLHQVAWKVVPQEETTTLAYFIDDYINHMNHHLRQILD